MSYQQPGRGSMLSRAIAAIILTGIYSFALIGGTALVFGVSSTAAQAQRGEGRGRGERGRGDRGRGRGERGRGRGRGDRGRGRGRGCVINAAGFRVCL